jgi:protein O-GlcNAc transferase
LKIWKKAGHPNNWGCPVFHLEWHGSDIVRTFRNDSMGLHGAKCGVVLLAAAWSVGCLAASANQDAIPQASALARSGKVKQAVTLLRSAVADDPDSAALHGALGKLLFTEQNYTDAVQELNQAEQLAPESREYNMLLAASLLGAKRYGVARSFLLAIQPRFEQYPEFHYSLGLVYYNLADSTKSRKELEEALRLDPKLDRARFLLAACAATDGDFPNAAEMLRRLVKDHPNNAIYWTTLGDLLRQMGAANRPEALRACRRALAIEPGNPHAEFVVATILLEAGDFAGARARLERLERISPKELEAHVALARVYGRLGRPDLARKETEIVRKLQEEQASENALPVPKEGSESVEQR